MNIHRLTAPGNQVLRNAIISPNGLILANFSEDESDTMKQAFCWTDHGFVPLQLPQNANCSVVYGARGEMPYGSVQIRGKMRPAVWRRDGEKYRCQTVECDRIYSTAITAHSATALYSMSWAVRTIVSRDLHDLTPLVWNIDEASGEIKGQPEEIRFPNKTRPVGATSSGAVLFYIPPKYHMGGTTKHRNSSPSVSIKSASKRPLRTGHRSSYSELVIPRHGRGAIISTDGVTTKTCFPTNEHHVVKGILEDGSVVGYTSRSGRPSFPARWQPPYYKPENVDTKWGLPGEFLAVSSDGLVYGWAKLYHDRPSVAVRWKPDKTIVDLNNLPGLEADGGDVPILRKALGADEKNRILCETGSEEAKELILLD